MKSTAILLTTLFVAGTALAADIGKPAPEFTVQDINGQTHQLSAYRGKIVVLEAYNLDCPFCALHYTTGATPELQAELTGKGVVWLVVNSVHRGHPSYRTAEVARKEFAQQKMKATAWINDSDGKLGKLYGLQTTPHLIVIDQAGVLAYDGAMDDKPATSGDPRQARNYLREAVTRLLAGEQVVVPRTKPYGCGVKYAD